MADKLTGLEMADTSRAIVEQCMDVCPNEEVFVIADAKTFDVGESIATAAAGFGADVVTAVMPLLESHGNEPLSSIEEGMVSADVAFTCTTHAITHTRARLRAAREGTRIGVLRGVTSEMMMEGAMSVDFEVLRRRTEALAELGTAAERVHVTSEQGTDVEFSIKGCQSFSLDGYFHEEYGFATLPPGESPTHPKEGTAEGTIVVDVSMDNLGQLDSPIELTLEDGLVTNVAGGEQAIQLEELFEEHGEDSRNLAEFAMGTNPKAKLIGNLAEDKKLEGTVHFAVGDNESLGGSVKSDIHLDGVLRSPTVHLDDTVVIENGQLCRELLE